MNRISLVGRLRTQKLLGRTVLILLAFSLLTVGGSYLFVRGEMVSRYREQGMEGITSWSGAYCLYCNTVCYTIISSYSSNF